MVRCQHVFSSVMFFGLHFHVEGHGCTFIFTLGRFDSRDLTDSSSELSHSLLECCYGIVRVDGSTKVSKRTDHVWDRFIERFLEYDKTSSQISSLWLHYLVLSFLNTSVHTYNMAIADYRMQLYIHLSSLNERLLF